MLEWRGGGGGGRRRAHHAVAMAMGPQHPTWCLPPPVAPFAFAGGGGALGEGRGLWIQAGMAREAGKTLKAWEGRGALELPTPKGGGVVGSPPQSAAAGDGVQLLWQSHTPGQVGPCGTETPPGSQHPAITHPPPASPGGGGWFVPREPGSMSRVGNGSRLLPGMVQTWAWDAARCRGPATAPHCSLPR